MWTCTFRGHIPWNAYSCLQCFTILTYNISIRSCIQVLNKDVFIQTSFWLPVISKLLYFPSSIQYQFNILTKQYFVLYFCNCLSHLPSLFHCILPWLFHTMASKTCANNVHKLCVTISSTNDSSRQAYSLWFFFFFERTHCDLIHWHKPKGSSCTACFV